MVVQLDDRDKVGTRLAQGGIETGIHYPVSPHLQAAYADHDVAPAEGLPVTERLAARCLNLPLGPHLDAQSTTAVLLQPREATEPE